MAETWLGALINEFIARWPLANVQLLAVNRPVDMIAEGIDIALSVSSGHCLILRCTIKNQYAIRYSGCQPPVGRAIS